MSKAKIGIVILSTIFALLLTKANLHSSEIDFGKIFLNTNKGVVLITGYDKNSIEISKGTGFFISDSGEITTNYHVIDNVSKVIIKTYDNKNYQVNDVVAFDTGKNIAVLKIDVKPSVVLTVGDSGKVAIGQPVCTIGNPRGFEKTLSQGIVSGLRSLTELTKEDAPGPDFPIRDEILLIQTTVAISPGSSGGPLIDANGEVVGITFLTNLGGQNFNFAVPSKYLKDLLSQPKREAPMFLSNLPKLPGPPTVMGLRFGMSMGEVQSKIILASLRKIDQKDDALVYKGSLVKIDDPERTYTYYKVKKFDDTTKAPEKKLREIWTYFYTDTIDLSMNDLTDRYTNLKNALCSKYGKPAVERKRVDPYFDDPDVRLVGFLTENAEYFCRWETEDLIITLQLKADPNTALAILESAGSFVGKTKQKYLEKIKNAKLKLSAGKLFFILTYSYKPLPIDENAEDAAAL